MKHGVTIDPALRDQWAREALACAKTAPSRAEAHKLIEGRYNVSQPTARNLISRGRYLEANPGEAND